MKKQILFLFGLVALLALLVWGFGKIGITFWNDGEAPLVSDEEKTLPFTKNGESWIRYTDAETGIRFEYRDEPSGYHFLESPGAGGEREHIKTYVLMLEEDYRGLLQTDTPVEGPSTITVLIFGNSRKLSPQAWAEANAVVSNIALALSSPREAVVGGANGISYRADGLYVSDVRIVASGGRIFVLSGSFLDEDSLLRRDFEAFLETVSFVPAKNASFRDGKYLGFIHAVGEGDVLYVEFDDATWLSGVLGQDAAIEAGVCTEATRTECLPNDYFIKNESPLDETLTLSAHALVFMQTYGMEESGEVVEREISLADFARLINDAASHWNRLPYTVTVENGTVTRIEEVYIP